MVKFLERTYSVYMGGGGAILVGVQFCAGRQVASVVGYFFFRQTKKGKSLGLGVRNASIGLREKRGDTGEPQNRDVGRFVDWEQDRQFQPSSWRESCTMASPRWTNSFIWHCSHFVTVWLS